MGASSVTLALGCELITARRVPPFQVSDERGTELRVVGQALSSQRTQKGVIAG
jgi:hypothetical protein